MPGDGLQEIDQTSLNRIIKVARSLDRLKTTSMDKFCSALSREVAIEFNRAMGKIIFDKTVESQPGAFPFVTLPEPVKVVAKATGELYQE